MSTILNSLLFLALLACAFVPACASGQTLSPETQDTLDAIAARQPKLTAADRAAARELNVKGDRAYRHRRYDAAFTDYMNSYPNAPNAYAYIMSADTYWRGVLEYQQSQSKGASGCPLDNTDFVHILSMNLNQEQKVGLALVDRHFPGTSLSPGFVQRAREETACLQAMAQKYASLPASSCIDLKLLEHCLGAPLIQ